MSCVSIEITHLKKNETAPMVKILLFSGKLFVSAPEVIGLQPYGHAADWWSLGVLACLMLTNKVEYIHFFYIFMFLITFLVIECVEIHKKSLPYKNRTFRILNRLIFQKKCLF